MRHGVVARRRSLLLRSMPLVAVLALMACKGPEPPRSRAQFSLQAPTQVRFQDQATYQSTLESISNVALAAEIDGRIIAMPMQEGQRVKPGDALFTLDQEQQQAQVNASAAEARKDRVNAERYIFLNDAGAVSTKDRDYYVTQAIESADKLRADAATLGYKQVVAPIAGEVGDIQHKLGAVVKEGETIVNIVDNSTLWVRLDVPAELAYRVKPGLPVTLRAPGSPELIAEGAIDFIAPSLDRNSQTLLVKASFENPERTLRDQQRVSATLSFGANTLWSVPVGAVLLQAGQTFVFTAVTPAQAQKALERPLEPKPKRGELVALQVPVTLGLPQNGRYPVFKGLEPSSKVVMGSLAQLRSGMVINTGSQAKP
ncbi:MAG: efflux RND transporter periplasmic adaptor subunit [Synechococcus sp. MED-G71]|nr:MAG: efflux RND transporter periplasmic adaptor subunit [Synechococcus sp. MED-G71]